MYGVKEGGGRVGLLVGSERRVVGDRSWYLLPNQVPRVSVVCKSCGRWEGGGGGAGWRRLEVAGGKGVDWCSGGLVGICDARAGRRGGGRM